VIKRPDREHFKAGNINHALKHTGSDYIAVFDSDQRPYSGFLADLVPILDDNERLAFVQTPQSYANTYSTIAAAASLQNTVFYGYVAEGKDVAGAMFCCGTNFLMRRTALDEVDGFAVNSLTEDMATTVKLHARGWQTKFHDTVYVTGMGPEGLSSYFKQHFRWATGTFQVLISNIKLLFKDPRALSGRQWLEYWMSCSYYLAGPVNFFFLLLPPAYMLFGIASIRANPFVYSGLFLAYLVSSLTLFLFTAWYRDYPLKRLFTVSIRLEMCKFHIYTKALISVLTGRRSSFKVTEKGVTKRLPWQVLSVPLTVLGLNAVAALAGLARLGVDWQFYLAINTFWAGYNVWMLSALIQYNNDSFAEPAPDLRVWAPGEAELS
jgi:cellulose synthase (UDP-forming)